MVSRSLPIAIVLSCFLLSEDKSNILEVSQRAGAEGGCAHPFAVKPPDFGPCLIKVLYFSHSLFYKDQQMHKRIVKGLGYMFLRCCSSEGGCFQGDLLLHG